MENQENTIYNGNKTFSNCPLEYTKLSQSKIECNNECNSYDKNKYEYKNGCYDLNNINKNYYCDVLCSEKNIFEIISINDFDIFCDMDLIVTLSCRLNYNGEHNNTIEQEIELKDLILEKIEKGFISNEYNTYSLDEGKLQIIKYNNMEITLTTTEEQKNLIEYNLTAIDFTEF